MPQKTYQNYELTEKPIGIKEQAQKIHEIELDRYFTGPDLDLIRNDEIAPELCPAVNTPIEVQDLRKIERAEKVDIQEWIDTAVEVLPEISEEIQMIRDEMAPVETNIILNHSQTQI